MTIGMSSQKTRKQKEKVQQTNHSISAFFPEQRDIGRVYLLFAQLKYITWGEKYTVIQALETQTFRTTIQMLYPDNATFSPA